jgi:drug/metabolite transporter (DMT)-like permease
MPEPEAADRERQAVNLFDLRRIIGGLFTVLGVLLIILGATDSQEEIDRAAGVNINLWGGLGMLALGLLFIAWALLRPLSEELASEEASPPPGTHPPRAGGEVGARSE